ncbi:MAG: hypothetical protein V1866_03115 [archaeon]
MNKKGLAMIQLVVGVIIIASIVFFLMYLLKVGFQARNAAVDSECTASIVAHATIVKTVGGDVAPDIYCPTKYYTILARNDENVKRFMADEMKSCWGTWGKGRLELFKDDGFYCHICSLVDFKGDQKQVNGLLDYLSTTSIPEGDGQGMTYIQYLASKSTEDVDPDLETAISTQQSPDYMDTSKSYAVIFAYAKGEGAMEKFMEKAGTVVGGGIAGGTAGFAVGSVILASKAAAIGSIGAVAATGGTVLVVIGVGVAAGAIIGWIASNHVEWASVTTIEEFNATNLKEMGCEISDVRQDKQADTLG